MRLSEAIRLGAMLRPQRFGCYAATTSDGEVGTCALGGALEAVGVSVETMQQELDFDLRFTSSMFDINLIDTTVACPECQPGSHHISVSVFYMIAHLNDTHRWTRERIADWVEVQENRLLEFELPMLKTELETEPEPEPEMELAAVVV